MEEGLFGLYSWYGDKLNKRENNTNFLPFDPRYAEKEFNYITELKDEIKNEIIGHLQIFNIGGKLYNGIKSFEFKKSINSKDEDFEIVQEIINQTYFADENKKADGTIDWLKLNILRRMKKRGYDEEISKQYIDKYAEKSQEILNRDVDGSFLNEKQKEALRKQSLRKCDTIKDTLPFTNNEFVNVEDHKKNILLEDLLIPKDTKQIILSSNNVTSNYKLNPKAIINPWISNFNTGYMSWNMVINKSTISCLLNKEHQRENWLFPARLILEKNPNDLFFENCFEELNNTEKTTYLGFFLIRYNLPDEKIPDSTHEECKHLYSFAGSKPHKSKEQYYVMFVFKYYDDDKSIPYKYFIVNFRCNKIPWGDTGELTKILSSEIRQINCMYVNDHFKLYLLLKKKTVQSPLDTLELASRLTVQDNKIEMISDICKSQYAHKVPKEPTQKKKKLFRL